MNDGAMPEDGKEPARGVPGMVRQPSWRNESTGSDRGERGERRGEEWAPQQQVSSMSKHAGPGCSKVRHAAEDVSCSTHPIELHMSTQHKTL